MDGGEAEGVGDLGKIVMVFPDHLLGQIHFHPGEIFDGAVAGSGSEQFLELRAADGIASAELFDGQRLADMGLHIFLHLREEFAVGFLFDGLYDVRVEGLVGSYHITADQLNEQLLQIESDQLFPGKTGAFGKYEFFLIGIVHAPGEDVFRFLDDLGQKEPFRLADLQYLFLEKGHDRGSAGEGHDYQIGSNQPVGIDVMKFIRLVKDDIPLFQGMEFLAGQHIHFPFVNT